MPPKADASTVEQRGGEGETAWTIYIYDEPKGPAYVLAFYIGKTRRKHRIPTLRDTPARRANYATGYVAESLARVGRGEPVTREKTNPEDITFEALAKKWTDGTLHIEYPSHVPEVDEKTSSDAATKVAKYITPHVGTIRVRDFTLEHALLVMQRVPSTLSPASRRHVAQALHRVLALACFPCRIIGVSPLPRGFLPRLGPSRARGMLLPEQDATLMRGTDANGNVVAPVARRLLLGFLAREGMRKEEAASLEWKNLNLARGWVYLDENKTDDRRDWPLDPGVAEALRVWRKLHPSTRYVFNVTPAPKEDAEDDDEERPPNVDHLPDDLRDDLRAVGIDETTAPHLFEHSAKRRRLNAHDLRGTFVTLSMAHGKGEPWIMRRTGHTTSAMLNKYRRTAANLAEGAEAALVPLVEAIPELAAARPRPAPKAPDPPPPETLSQGCPAGTTPEVSALSLGDDSSANHSASKSGPHGVRTRDRRIKRTGFAGENEGDEDGQDDGVRPSSPAMDNGGTFDLARALGLARAVAALVDGGATTSARPIVAELVALLETVQGDGGDVVSLDVERARRGR
jgi:integrase